MKILTLLACLLHDDKRVLCDVIMFRKISTSKILIRSKIKAELHFMTRLILEG